MPDSSAGSLVLADVVPLQGNSVWSAAQRTPDALAIVGPDGAELTFEGLVRRVNRISHGLRAIGLRAGDVVAVALPNSTDFFVLALATGQIGMHVVPVSVQLSGPEASYIVEDSGAAAVVVANDAAADALRASGPIPLHLYVAGGRKGRWPSMAELEADQPDSLPTDRLGGELMGYTSGTTGRPKGVRRPLSGLAPEEANARFLSMSAALGINGQTGAHLVCSPLHHAAPFGFALGSLHLGHCVIVLERFDAEGVLAGVARYGVTESHMVPTHFHRLLRLPAERRARADMSSLRSLVHAGAVCPVHIKRAMIDWVGPVLNEYLGATEGAVAMVSSVEWLAHPGTVGRPLRGVRVELLDERGSPVPTGAAGTIYFSTGGAPFEYHNAPEKTAATRLGDLVTVGDVGRFDGDGYLYVLDRRVDMIVTGGVNVYPAEIEGHLLAHPEVADVVVFGVPDEEWGNQVVAVVAAKDAASLNPDLESELLRHCEAALAPYKKPRRLLLGAVPRTANGKLLRRVAREEFLSADPRSDISDHADRSIPAHSDGDMQ